MSEDENDLFKQFMKDVTPLKQNKPKIPSEGPKVIRPIKKTRLHEPSNVDEFHLSDFIKDPVSPESTLSYSEPSLDNKSLRALKSGQIRWEAVLDLHGLNTEEARLRLIQFMRIHSEQQHRCVLIIHGKGGHQGGQPVIKNLINRWLPQFPQVLAFQSALPRDGGTGALYVLLKRQIK